MCIRDRSHKKREELKKKPSSQIDTDSHSTAKRKKQYFGYKDHMGTDMGSDLIRKKAFASAQPHDSQLLNAPPQQMKQLLLETVLTAIKKINKKHERMGFTTVFWIKEPENINSDQRKRKQHERNRKHEQRWSVLLLIWKRN